MRQKQPFLRIDRDPTLYTESYIGMFDLTKGLLMLEIILSHSMDPYGSITFYLGQLSAPIQLLASPLLLLRYGSPALLFLTCGFGLRRTSMKNSIKKSLELFLSPFLCVIIALICGTVAKWVLFGGDLVQHLADELVPFLTGFFPGYQIAGGRVDDVGPLWFIFVYAVGCVYLNWVLQQKETWVQTLIVSLGVAVGLLTSHTPLPCFLQHSLICSGLMYLGYRCKQAKLLKQPFPLFTVVLVWLACSLNVYLGGYADLSMLWFIHGGVEVLLLALTGTVMLLLRQRMNVLQGRLADALRWLGGRMIWLSCAHTVTYLLVPWDKVALLFGSHVVAGTLFAFISSTLFAIAGCVFLDRLARRRMERRRGKQIAPPG